MTTVYTHRNFGELSAFQLDQYLEFLSFTMQKINSLEVHDVENDLTAAEYDEASLRILRDITNKKDEVENAVISAL